MDKQAQPDRRRFLAYLRFMESAVEAEKRGARCSYCGAVHAEDTPQAPACLAVKREAEAAA
jgi:hypothetical protein